MDLLPFVSGAPASSSASSGINGNGVFDAANAGSGGLSLTSAVLNLPPLLASSVSPTPTPAAGSGSVGGAMKIPAVKRQTSLPSPQGKGGSANQLHVSQVERDRSVRVVDKVGGFQFTYSPHFMSLPGWWSKIISLRPSFSSSSSSIRCIPINRLTSLRTHFNTPYSTVQYTLYIQYMILALDGRSRAHPWSIN